MKLPWFPSDVKVTDHTPTTAQVCSNLLLFVTFFYIFGEMVDGQNPWHGVVELFTR